MDERKHLFYAGQCDRNREKGNDFASRSQQARVHIRTRCGGKASCLMCKVKVLDREGAACLKRKKLESWAIGSTAAIGWLARRGLFPQ